MNWRATEGDAQGSNGGDEDEGAQARRADGVGAVGQRTTDLETYKDGKEDAACTSVGCRTVGPPIKGARKGRNPHSDAMASDNKLFSLDDDASDDDAGMAGGSVAAGGGGRSAASKRPRASLGRRAVTTLGEQGRRTGITAPSNVAVDAHGLEDVDAYFKEAPKPAPPPPPAPAPAPAVGKTPKRAAAAPAPAPPAPATRSPARPAKYGTRRAEGRSQRTLF